ncbi:hypothetical protein ACFVYE_24745 [Streptomyces sp. NPDC058239]|uniref:hypothetical protein n=1 Tax=Streptomyces sp. NPDC058239 TaxID=3346395 RepID=UPI0036E1B472
MVATAAGPPGVDASRIAAIGFCFGGLWVLDMARTGAPVTGGGRLPRHADPAVRSDSAEDRLQGRGVSRLGRPVRATGRRRRADGGTHRFRGRLAVPRVRPDRALLPGGRANRPEPGIAYDARSAERARSGLRRFLAERLDPTD